MQVRVVPSGLPKVKIGLRKEVAKRTLKAMVGLRVVVLVGLACSLNGLERRRNMPAENGPGSVTPHWTDIYEKPNSESLLLRPSELCSAAKPRRC